MCPNRLHVEPFADKWEQIRLSEELVESYSLDKWADEFDLMTAGYRERLDPQDALNPAVPFNALTVAIMGEAKARVFGRKLAADGRPHVHVGGETRPHTQQFIAILSRVYAAHEMIVHLRGRTQTTPIWYSSFGTFYRGYQSADNLTASHSPFFKGGWKPLDGAGKQLLAEEGEIVAEVRNIVKSRATISLAPWTSTGRILRDFDVDEAYVAYQQAVLTENSIGEVARAVEKGFRCSICTMGGSMARTTERLFELLGIAVGEHGAIQYFLDEEDAEYHGVGQVGGEHVGPDPGKSQVYQRIGAQERLVSGTADVVFIWDPDGDRFNMATIAPADMAETAEAAGLHVERVANSEHCLVYFSPNQIFFLLTAYRIGVLKAAEMLRAHDWFVACSVSASRAIGELAARENLPVAFVRVGFKHMGTLAEWIETRRDFAEAHTNPTAEEVLLGEAPRALMMCEESGGSAAGGPDLLMNETGTASLVALREKDGMQLGLFSLCLAAHLYNSGSSFAEYYCDLVTEYEIQNRHFVRLDARLYDESQTGAERHAAREQGINTRNRIMGFLASLSARAGRGVPLDVLAKEINAKVPQGCDAFPCLRRICGVGDGTLLEFDRFWCLVRASGTDAVIRYYVEGCERSEVQAYQRSLSSLRI